MALTDSSQQGNHKSWLLRSTARQLRRMRLMSYDSDTGAALLEAGAGMQTTDRGDGLTDRTLQTSTETAEGFNWRRTLTDTERILATLSFRRFSDVIWLDEVCWKMARCWWQRARHAKRIQKYCILQLLRAAHGARFYQTMTLLPSGKVLVTGGLETTIDPIVLNAAELYTP